MMFSYASFVKFLLVAVLFTSSVSTLPQRRGIPGLSDRKSNDNVTVQECYGLINGGVNVLGGNDDDESAQGKNAAGSVPSSLQGKSSNDNVTVQECYGLINGGVNVLGGNGDDDSSNPTEGNLDTRDDEADEEDLDENEGGDDADEADLDERDDDADEEDLDEEEGGDDADEEDLDEGGDEEDEEDLDEDE